jgi:hypothetical protein
MHCPFVLLRNISARRPLARYAAMPLRFANAANHACRRGVRSSALGWSVVSASSM